MNKPILFMLHIKLTTFNITPFRLFSHRRESFFKRLFLLIPICFCLISCNKTEKKIADFEIGEFKTLTNWNTFADSLHSQKLILLDYTDAIDGFEIPSKFQTSDGYFDFYFTIKNTSGNTQKFFYKIYYQNETYKFPETDDNGKLNPLSEENFYGSWETPAGFAETQEIPSDGNFHTVNFKLKITGNPRNEEKYFDGNLNNRWKRNPRTGEYSFLLVVTHKTNIENKKIPDYISDITKKQNEVYLNPYYFFLFGEGKKINNISVLKSKETLLVKAVVPLQNGIYIDPDQYSSDEYLKGISSLCDTSNYLYRNAAISPFKSHITKESSFYNIPVIADVLEKYTLSDYNYNRVFHHQNSLVLTSPQNSPCPCSNIITDTTAKKITFINEPATPTQPKKQNAGIKTRHCFTYGKYTVKIKMTELLNKSGVWNGITNSIWLVSQQAQSWNNCRKCNHKGYLPNYEGGSHDIRSPYTSYSEIDFEILKTVSYCPSYQFPPPYYIAIADSIKRTYWDVPLPEYLKKDSANVMICCTNWDMACPEPPKYDVGCKPIQYQNKTFYSHRWDYWYRALSQRYPFPDDELFGREYYFFQIEWKPTEIIWRVGPEKDKLITVGYMNNTVTTIPNNQMMLVISQEFHSPEWWHGSPFLQQFIPFPKKELTAYIYEITIE